VDYLSERPGICQLGHHRRAEVPLDNQRDGSAQSRLRRSICGYDPSVRTRQAATPYFLGDERPHPIPGGRDVTDDHDHFWRQPCRQRGDANAKKATHARERVDGAAVAVVGPPQDVVEARRRLKRIAPSSRGCRTSMAVPLRRY
jgi:hypothetical protein